MNEPLVILVNENDIPTGVSGKMEAHVKGLLHRAVSVFIFDSRGNWILQRRAFDKYHSNGLWTNTCCTHPLPGESNILSAKRRLKQEMGITCELTWLFSFTYRERLDNELTEHELDHVFFGMSDEKPEIDTSEVEEWEAVSFGKLQKDIRENPSGYTFWFREIYGKVHSHLKEAGILT